MALLTQRELQPHKGTHYAVPQLPGATAQEHTQVTGCNSRQVLALPGRKTTSLPSQKKKSVPSCSGTRFPRGGWVWICSTSVFPFLFGSFEVLVNEPRAHPCLASTVPLSYSPSPFKFFILTEGLSKLPRLGLNFASWCLCLLNSWDCRCLPACLCLQDRNLQIV